MALGSIILTGLTAGPALAILGFTIAGKGENDLKQAIEYKEEVEEEITKLSTGVEKLKHIQQQICETSNLISEKHIILRGQMSIFDTNLDSDCIEQYTQSLEMQKIEELVKEIFGVIKQPIAD